jgi:hypothetical protein
MKWRRRSTDCYGANPQLIAKTRKSGEECKNFSFFFFFNLWMWVEIQYNE